MPEIGDQEHDGKQERERPRHLQLLGQQCVGGAAEAHLFLWLAAESAHHLESGDVLLQDRVERTDAHLDGHEERLRDRAEEQEHAKCDGQDGQDDQGEGRIAEPQHEQRGDQQDERLEREDQALADEEAHFLDVVRGADHQLAGLGAIQIAERQALDSGEQLVAKIEGDVLGDALGVVLLAKGEHSANGTEDDDRDHRAKERLDGQAPIGLELDAADHRVDDDAHQLRHHELGGGGHEQRAVGQHRQAAMTGDVAYGAQQGAEIWPRTHGHE